MAKVRNTYIFSGQVQAWDSVIVQPMQRRANGLTGWVDNLWDGRVEMEVQGELSQIEEMIQEIQMEALSAEKYQMEDLPVDEEEWSFFTPAESSG